MKNILLLTRSLLCLLAVCAALALPSSARAQVEPTERKIDGGITHINLSIPVTNGKFVRSDVYLPPGGKPLPGVIVLPTYYAQIFGGSEDFDKEYAIALARQGYATVVPTLSHLGGANGYSGTHGEDLVRISRWLRDRPEVMDDRIGAVGFSMGSYHAAQLAMNDPATRVTIGYYGVYDLESRELYFSRTVQRFWPHSPAPNAQRLNGAVLLLHGTGDNETPPSQAVTYRDALAAAGKKVELVSYPGAYHRFDRGPTGNMIRANQGERTPQGHIYRLDKAAQADAWARTNAWLEQYLKAD